MSGSGLKTLTVTNRTSFDAPQNNSSIWMDLTASSSFFMSVSSSHGLISNYQSILMIWALNNDTTPFSRHTAVNRDTNIRSWVQTRNRKTRGGQWRSLRDRQEGIDVAVPTRSVDKLWSWRLRKSSEDSDIILGTCKMGKKSWDFRI